MPRPPVAHAAVSDTRHPSSIHLPGLDLLRGLAIALVLVHNLSLLEGRPNLVAKLWGAVVQAGWVGVQLFFVLSGFLITGILLDDRGRPGAIRSFYIRRFLRIFPLYYAFLGVYFFVLAPLFPALRAPFSQAVWYWLYLSNWATPGHGALPGLGPLWSLAVEEQFYIVWPWLIHALSPRGAGRLCVAVIALALAGRIAMVVAHVDPNRVYAATISRADALALGGLLAVAIREPSGPALLARAVRPVSVVLLLALAALAAVTHGVNRVNPLMQTLGYSVMAALSAVLIARAVLAGPEADRPAWWQRALRSLGKYSYAIYVLHIPFKEVAERNFSRQLAAARVPSRVGPDLLFVIGMSVLCYGLARITWVVLERPFLRLKDRWAPR